MSWAWRLRTTVHRAPLTASEILSQRSVTSTASTKIQSFHSVLVFAGVLLHARSGQSVRFNFFRSTRKVDSDARGRNVLDFLSSLYGGPAHPPPVPYISGVRAVHRPDGTRLHDPVRPIHLVLRTALRSARTPSHHARIAGRVHSPYPHHSDGALRSANSLVEALDGIGRERSGPVGADAYRGF